VSRISDTIDQITKHSHTNGIPSAAVNGAELLSSVAGYLNRFVRMPAGASDAFAAFVTHTHLAPRLDIVAYVHIFSAEKQCGKTVLMDSAKPLCANSLNAGDASVAAIARSLAKPRTVFIDELDALLKGDKERAEVLRGILNQGYKKGGTYLRCEPPKYEAVEFPIFGPKVFAGIGRRSLPDTLRDRSVPIALEKIMPEDVIEPLFERRVLGAAIALHDRTKAWAEHNGDRIVARIDELYQERRSEPVLSRLSPRAFEIWVALVAICDAAGADWPARIRIAAESLMLGEDVEDRSQKERLLSNVYSVFEGQDVTELPGVDPQTVERIQSVELAHRLNANEEWEWADWSRRDKDRGIKPRQIATLLKEFRIRPKTIREGDEVFKGYERGQFENVWKAYRVTAVASPPHADQLHRLQPDNMRV